MNRLLVVLLLAVAGSVQAQESFRPLSLNSRRLPRSRRIITGRADGQEVVPASLPSLVPVAARAAGAITLASDSLPSAAAESAFVPASREIGEGPVLGDNDVSNAEATAPTMGAVQAMAAKAAGADVVADEYVVIFKSGVAAPAALTRAFAEPLAAKMASARALGRAGAAGAVAAPAEPFTVKAESMLSSGADAVPFSTIKVAEGADAGEVLDALLAQPDVEEVVPNTIFHTMQAPGTCTIPSKLASYTPVHKLDWKGCLKPNSVLVWYGTRCGAENDQIQWTGVYAANKATLAPMANCHATVTDAAYANTAIGAAVFGGCGVAPTLATLPTSICPTSSASSCMQRSALAATSVSIGVRGCGVTTRTVAYKGVPCGANNDMIRWNAFTLTTPAGPRCPQRLGANPIFNNNWFGSCGTPPAYLVNMPTRLCDAAPPPANPPAPPPTVVEPPAPGAGLAREALRSGESDLPGMSMIEAATGGRVPVNPAGAGGPVVAVLDTGGSSLSDLNTLPGMSVLGGVTGTNWQDVQRHGTHVAGTIAARNNGAGVWGVFPGVRVMPIKVLNDNGSGSLGDILAAINWVAANAAARNINVINMSLGGAGTPLAAICRGITAARAAGVIVAVAAGNENKDLRTSIPAACPDAVAVTALDPHAAQRGVPAGFSNYLPMGSSPEDQRRTIAAPGVGILSTMPDGTYQAYSGTSMAAPHVAGAAARCFASGACRLSDGAAATTKFLDNVWAKYRDDAAYRWSANNMAGAKYFGPAVWAAQY